jgi:quercetin dioxygenase-like cupin family protein
MSTNHLVRTTDQANFEVPRAYAKLSEGFTRWTIVNRDSGSVHQEFNICQLEPGGSIRAHIHAFEESVYVLEGQLICETNDGRFALDEGDYGVIHVAAPHAYQNEGAERVLWVEMLAPQPRLDGDGDTFPVEPHTHTGTPLPIDPRDPRTRFFGNITKNHSDPARQSQDLLAVSASMRTALLVYSGITVKMMVDSDLGAYLHTMFMVFYNPGGVAGTHDHPFEETYLILEGEVDAWFDGNNYRLRPGDVAWAGVGCVHGFRNASNTETVRWLETSAPQPPSRYAYRFARDWNYLQEALSRKK